LSSFLRPNFGSVKLTTEILYEQPDLTETPLGTLIADPIERFKLEFEKLTPVDPDQIDQATFIIQVIAEGQFRRTAGTGSTRFDYSESSDDITYTNAFSMGSSNTSFNDASFQSSGTFLQPDTKFIRGAFYNSLADTVGEWKYMHFYVNLVSPNGYSVKRLI